MKKPTLPQLCLVEWLYENRFRAFITDSSPVYEGFECHVLTGESDDQGRKVVRSLSAYERESESESGALTERFGGRRNFDLTFLQQNGILNRGRAC